MMSGKSYSVLLGAVIIAFVYTAVAVTVFSHPIIIKLHTTVIKRHFIGKI